MTTKILISLTFLLVSSTTSESSDLWNFFEGAQQRSSTFNCPSEGFFGDQTDCHIFYRCVTEASGLKAIRFECGPGTVFDTKNNICTHPWSSGRPECGGLELSNEIPEENPQGYPEKLQSTTTTPRPVSTTPTTSWTTEKAPQKENEIPHPIGGYPDSQNEVLPARPASNGCQREGFMSDPQDCNKFYRCVESGNGFTKYEFSCASGTIWDDDVQSCNYPWATKRQGCGSSPGGSSPGGGRPAGGSPALPASENSESNNLEPGGSFGTYPEYPQNVQYPSGSGYPQGPVGPDYSSNYNPNPPQVSTGLPQEGYGPPLQATTSGSVGTSTPVTTQAQTSTTPPVPSETTPQTSSPSTEGFTESSAGSGGSEPSTPSTELLPDNECTRSGFMGDSKDCQIFYRCVENEQGSFTRYEFKCGPGTVWDQEANSCNHPWAVSGRCGTKIEEFGGEKGPETPSSGSPGSSTELPGGEPTENGLGSTPEAPGSTTTPGETTTTLQTSTMSPASTQTPSEGLQSTSQTPDSSTSLPEATTTPQVSTTVPESTSSSAGPGGDQSGDKCTSEGFKGDTKDCKKFYRCVSDERGGFTKYEFTCGEGTVWDQDTESCNHPWNVGGNCGTGSGPSGPSGTTETPKGETTTGSTTGEGSTTSRPVEGTTSTSEEPKGESTMSPEVVTSPGSTTTGQGSTTIGEGSTSVAEGSTTPSGTTASPEAASTTEISTESSTGTAPTSPQSSNGTCTKDGFIGDRSNCKKFFRCVENEKGGFTKYDFSCGEGTVWDQDSESCNHPWAVQGSCRSESDSQGATATTSGTAGASESTTGAPEGTDSTPGPTESTTGASGVTESTSVVSGATESTTGVPGATESTSGATESTTGIPGATETTSGVPGATETTPSVPGTTEATSSVPGATETTTSSSGVPEGTTQASGKEETSQPSQGGGTTPSSTTKAPGPAKPPACTEEGFMEDPSNCKLFYRCVGNGRGGFTRYQFSCGEGTVWDPSIESCNHPWATDRDCSGAGEQNEPSPSTPQGSSPSTSSTGSPEVSSSAPIEATSSGTGGPSSASTSATTSPGSESSKNDTKPCDQTTVAPQKISCTGEGFYAHPSNCKKFYRCVDQGNGRYSVYHFDCPPGTIFDPSISTCNHENSVYPARDCSGSSAPQGSTTEATTEAGKTTTPSSETTTDSSTETSTIPSEGTTTVTDLPSTEPVLTTTEAQETTSESGSTEALTTTSSGETTTSSAETTTSSVESTTSSGETATSGEPTESSPESTTTSVEATTISAESTTSGESTTAPAESTTLSAESTTSGESTTSSAEATTELETTTLSQTTPEAPAGDCPKLEEGQIPLVCPTGFRRHPKYCDLFYQCTMDPQTYNMKILVMRCPNETMYDSRKIQCLPEGETEEQCTGELSEKGTGTLRDFQLNYAPPPVEIKSSKKLCAAPGHYSMDPTKCDNMYISCEKTKSGLEAYMYQCPFGFTYWPVSRKCERISPVLNCGTTTEFEKRWELPVANI